MNTHLSFLYLRHRWMKRHSPPFQQDHYHKRHKYWTFMRQVIDNLQPMTGYGNAERACKYIDKMQEVDERETTRSSSSILVAQMIRSVYIPPTKLRKAIIADTINRRIWMRVCDKNYQQHVGIHDYLSFIEVALTQPEFQCLVCNNQVATCSNKKYRDGLSIPLVRGDSYHCMRCDYNFCKECIDTNTSYDSHCCYCPNCMTLDSFKKNDKLIHVLKAAHIPPLSLNA